MRRLWVEVLSVASLSLAVACGAEDGNEDGAQNVIETSGPLLPWQVGYSWTYEVTGDGETSTKVTTIEAAETVGGQGPNAGLPAFKVITKKGALDQTVSWQAAVGDKVVRYREQAFHASTGELEAEEYWVPHKIHVDGSPAHTVADAQWVEEYQETKLPVGKEGSTKTQRDAWSVDAVDQIVTVPAGTFRAIVLQKAGGSNLKTYWYVPGVGKVKETGGQTEVLVSYKTGTP